MKDVGSEQDPPRELSKEARCAALMEDRPPAQGKSQRPGRDQSQSTGNAEAQSELRLKKKKKKKKEDNTKSSLVSEKGQEGPLRGANSISLTDVEKKAETLSPSVP